MRILTYTFETVLHMDSAVSDHDFVLRCQPMSTFAQTVLDAQTIITPQTTLSQQIDGFGNLLQIGRIEAPHDVFSFVSSGMLVIDAGDAHPEPAHPIYKRPSAMTVETPEMLAFVRDVLRVIPNASPEAKAKTLSHALCGQMEYSPGATDVATTAAETFSQKRGVCQDFSHILIALLHGEKIPARYVNGLVIGEGATHAWVEFHDGVRWRGIDPTNDRFIDDTYIALSHERDFTDCPIESGVFRGGARQKQQVSVVVGGDQ